MQTLLQNKRLLLIITLPIIPIIITLILGLSSRNTPQPQRPIIYTPTPVSYSSNELNINSILPPEDTERIDPPIQPVEITFNKAVSKNDIRISTQPTTDLYVDNKPGSPNIVIISPNPIWLEGITRITILPETKSEDGTLLNKQYQPKIKSELPKNPPDWGNPYD